MGDARLWFQALLLTNNREEPRSHIKGILGYWKLDGATNASMEGFNGKVRWLIKQAYGFRDFKYFRLKIFDLPSTDIRKRL